MSSVGVGCVLPFSGLDAVTHDSTEFLRIAALLKLKPQQFDLAAKRFDALPLRTVVAIGSRAATPLANHPKRDMQARPLCSSLLPSDVS